MILKFYKCERVPKIWRERHWTEKLYFWRKAEKIVWIETEEKDADYQEVLIYDRDSYKINSPSGIEKEASVGKRYKEDKTFPSETNC